MGTEGESFDYRKYLKEENEKLLREQYDKRGSRRPRLDFTFAGNRFNVLDILSKRDRLTGKGYVKDMRPGDEEAMMLLSHFTNVGVTPEEYLTAMPELFQSAVIKEGGMEGGKDLGFDGDFLLVAEWLIGDTQARMGGEDVASLPKEQRLAFFGRVYGKLELLKQTIWKDPAQAEYKKRFVEHAEKMLIARDEFPDGGYMGSWGAVLARKRLEERSGQPPD